MTTPWKATTVSTRSPGDEGNDDVSDGNDSDVIWGGIGDDRVIGSTEDDPAETRSTALTASASADLGFGFTLNVGAGAGSEAQRVERAAAVPTTPEHSAPDGRNRTAPTEAGPRCRLLKRRTEQAETILVTPASGQKGRRVGYLRDALDYFEGTKVVDCLGDVGAWDPDILAHLYRRVKQGAYRGGHPTRPAMFIAELVQHFTEEQFAADPEQVLNLVISRVAAGADVAGADVAGPQ